MIVCFQVWGGVITNKMLMMLNDVRLRSIGRETRDLHKMIHAFVLSCCPCDLRHGEITCWGQNGPGGLLWIWELLNSKYLSSSSANGDDFSGNSMQLRSFWRVWGATWWIKQHSTHRDTNTAASEGILEQTFHLQWMKVRGRCRVGAYTHIFARIRIYNRIYLYNLIYTLHSRVCLACGFKCRFNHT